MADAVLEPAVTERAERARRKNEDMLEIDNEVWQKPWDDWDKHQNAGELSMQMGNQWERWRTTMLDFEHFSKKWIWNLSQICQRRGFGTDRERLLEVSHFPTNSH